VFPHSSLIVTLGMLLWVLVPLIQVVWAEGSHDHDLIDIINSIGTTWKAGVNFEGRDGVEPFANVLLGARPRPNKTLELRESLTTNLPIPFTFDSRKKWPYCPTISQIQDQSACGGCWAVASAATFSDRLCIASNGSITVSLSSDYLISCCGKMCGDGCNGGDDYRAWVFFKMTGLVTGGLYGSNEGCQPFPMEPCLHHVSGDRRPCEELPPPPAKSCHAACPNKLYKKNIDDDFYKVKSSYKVMSSVQSIQKEIMIHGPVQAGFTVYEDVFHYKSGVYRHTVGKKYGEHSVRIIGWGNEKGTPYWLVANSWNTDWGDQGTFKVLQGSNECGIEEAVHAGIPLV